MPNRDGDEAGNSRSGGSKRRQTGRGYYSDDKIPQDIQRLLRVSKARRPSPPSIGNPSRGRSTEPGQLPNDADYHAHRIPSPPPTSRSRRHRHQDKTSTAVHRAASPSSSHSHRKQSSLHVPAPHIQEPRIVVHNSAYLAPPDRVPSNPAPSHRITPSLALPEDTTPASPPRRPSFIISPITAFSQSQGSSSSGVLGAGPKFYQYNPLRPSEIRLIRLNPARSSSTKCDIFHFPLNEAPSYSAISYAWGDVGDEHNIELSGVTVSITVSLHGALGAVRDRGGRHVWVWADALCIDQQNRDEKEHQLQLMTDIYKKAQSVAIWLGPEGNNSVLATKFLEELYTKSHNREPLGSFFSSLLDRRQDIEAVISLFERDYWDRLWVVQEVFNAKTILVYCGATKLPWSIYEEASHIFWEYKPDIESCFPGGTNTGRRGMGSHKQLSTSQVLAYEGPSSILDRRFLEGFNKPEKVPDNMLFKALLEVMRRYRRKLSGDPKDKVFGILGVLPERIRRKIPANYGLSVKDVYTNVVDILIHTTNRLDVICECIHFPRYISPVNLPTWVPDWSYIPDVKALGTSFEFSADGERTKALWRFRGNRRQRLQISAVYLGSIKTHGVSVGTLCNLADYLMAFLHWRALLLNNFPRTNQERRAIAQEEFCLTLSLGHGPAQEQSQRDWMETCYSVFASLLTHRLPELPLDGDLASHLATDDNVGESQDRREFIQKHFRSQMTGRCFCITDGDLMGLGTGFMTVDDIVVVPFGCSTPIVLRQEGDEFRFVGDVYIHGYMYGQAVQEYEDRKRELRKYVLH